MPSLSIPTLTMPRYGDSNSWMIYFTSSIALAGLLTVQLLTDSDPIGKCARFWRQLRVQESKLTSSDKTVNGSANAYVDFHKNQDAAKRTAAYQELVNAYYDLATVFYEWGWGGSFHFAVQHKWESSFAESIRRHEYQLASFLQPTVASAIAASASSIATPTMPVASLLDVGCGISGPMRNIARFFNRNVKITGITLNEYQVNRGNEITKSEGLSEYCHSVQGDFMHLPFEDASFEGAYAIEATCHAPNRVLCYSEIARTLKPGSIFCCYEWCMTDKYDPTNAEHQRLKKDIELGSGLPDIVSTHECLQAMKDAGYEIVTAYDAAINLEPCDIPWETPLLPSWNPLSQRFQFNSVGGPLTNFSISLLEFLRIAPAGTVKTQRVLQAGGFALRDAARVGILTTMYVMVGRKP